MPVTINARKLVETFISETGRKPGAITVAQDVWLALQRQCGYNAKVHGPMETMHFMGYTVHVNPQLKPGMIAVGLKPATP